MTTNTQSITIEYGRGPKQVGNVDTTERLDAELDRIDQEARAADLPELVGLVAPDGRLLSLGLGADESVVSWLDEEAEQDNLSRGNRDTGEPVSFSVGGDWTEFPPFAAVPVEVARQAARDFLRTGQRPDEVAWQE